MNKLVIDLPDTVGKQLQQHHISEQELTNLITHFLELYLSRPELLRDLLTVFEPVNQLESPVLKLKTPDKVANSSSTTPPRPRFGSGKHLNIVMSDDFDEPLEDFAAYMS